MSPYSSHDSTLCILLFCAWVCPGAPHSSMHSSILLAFLPDFLFIGMDHSWAWRWWSLSTNQLWLGVPSRTLSHGLLPSRPLKMSDYFPETQGCERAFCPSPSPEDSRILNSTITVTAAKSAFDLHITNLLMKRKKSSRASPLVVLSVTWRRKLLSVHSRNVQDFLEILLCFPSKRYWEQLKFPRRTKARECEVAPSCL